MKYILPIILVLTTCQKDSESPEWFVGAWISDPDLTINENEHFSELRPEEINAIREMLGSLRWEVNDSELIVVRPEINSRVSYEYTIKLDYDEELTFSSEGAGDMKIRNVSGGICADFMPLPGIEPLLVSECFTRYDT